MVNIIKILLFCEWILDSFKIFKLNLMQIDSRLESLNVIDLESTCRGIFKKLIQSKSSITLAFHISNVST